MNAVTVIINNRDLLAWPKKMCDDIQRMHGVHEIIIIDNGSSNRALLQWYKECSHKVIFLENMGHTAPWACGILDSIDTDLYVVTDPDLDLSGVPDDAILHLSQILLSYPKLGKVGLSLETNDIPVASPYFNHVKNYEKHLMGECEVVENLFVSFPVDTTFAVHDRRFLREYKICGARSLAPYIAKHIPWYIIEPSDEFRYYLDNASNSSSYKKFVDHAISGPLSTLYRQHVEGKVSAKWSSYFPIYEKWFDPYRKDQINLLEIGVQNGGSLEIWSKYFPKGNLFVGCDINPAVSKLEYSDNRVKIVVGPASNPSTVSAVAQHAPEGFDIIIDDGSHHSIDTISNFVCYFGLLKPGGLFVIEDMHCAYWPEYGGGFFNYRSAASFFKSLADIVNIEHVRDGISARHIFQTFFEPAKLPSMFQDGSIASITFYNSVFIIEKSTQRVQPLLGTEVIVGNDWAVEPRVRP